jgi:DNA-binding response OmpR family regulator
MPPRLPLANRSVLVVDDDPDILSLLAELLGAQGFDVVPASDGIDALSYLYARCPAAVLIDLRMPRMDGLELIRQMRSDRALADVVVVAMSGARDMLGRAKEAGAQAVLLKPFDSEALLRTLRAHIRDASDAGSPRAGRGEPEQDAVA